MVSATSGRARKAANPPAPPPVPGVVWATAEVETQIRWPWQGIIPSGSVMMLEGRKGTGKSSIAAAIAASIAGIQSLPGWTPSEGRPILWAASEEHHTSTVIPRYALTGAPKHLLGRPFGQDSRGKQRKIKLPSDLLVLEEAIKLSNCGLLILDPFVSFVDLGIDLTKEQSARSFIEPLIELMQETDCICLLIRHIRKGRGGDMRDAGLGSAAVGNASRGILRCDEHPFNRDEYVFSVVALNDAKRAQPLSYRFKEVTKTTKILEWIGHCDLTMEEIAAGKASGGEKDEENDAVRLIVELIGAGSIPVKQVQYEAANAMITPKILRNAKERLGVVSKRVSMRGSGHWEWTAPNGGFRGFEVEIKPKKRGKRK